ncbi:MAG: MFS transporter [Dehalococcoidia bacterium]|nr:MFS transporter [Dehalococcoidia bacterium]
MAGTSAAEGYDTRRQVRVLYAVSGLVNLNPHIAVWVIYLMEFRGISLAQVGLMEGMFWSVTLALEIPSGAISDRYGRKVGFLLGTVIEGSGVLMFALADSFPLLMASYVVWGSGIAFRSGNDGAFLYDALSADGKQGDYADRMGVLAAVMRFAAAGGAIAGGAIAEVTSLQVVVFFGAASFMGALLALIPMREPPRTSTVGPQSYGQTFVEA